MGIGYSEDLTTKSLDRVLSFGEQLSAPIVAGALKSLGINSVSLTGYEAGIVTDSRFGKAKPIPRKLSRRIKPRLKGLIEKGGDDHDDDADGGAADDGVELVEP